MKSFGTHSEINYVICCKNKGLISKNRDDFCLVINSEMSDLLNPEKENFSEEELRIEEQFRPQSFNDFTGQMHILDNLEIFVKAAK